MWSEVGRFILPKSDPAWQWRRRLAFAGCTVGLWGMVHAIRFEPDHAWGGIVLATCATFFTTCMGIYAGLATYAEHKKHQADKQKSEAGT